jgi:nicotinamidase-related amidase
LVVVDVQNDVADPAGSLYVRDGESVIDVANTEIEAARRAGALIVYTMDWHPPARPTSPRTVTSGRSTVWLKHGAPSSIPD